MFYTEHVGWDQEDRQRSEKTSSFVYFGTMWISELLLIFVFCVSPFSAPKFRDILKSFCALHRGGHVAVPAAFHLLSFSLGSSDPLLAEKGAPPLKLEKV